MLSSAASALLIFAPLMPLHAVLRAFTRRDYTLRRECQEQLIEITGELIYEGNYKNWNLLFYLC